MMRSKCPATDRSLRCLQMNSASSAIYFKRGLKLSRWGLSSFLIIVTAIGVLSYCLRPASAQTAATKVPLTHETMWMLKRVGTPAPSHDGKWVVFPLIEPAYEEKDQVLTTRFDRSINSFASTPDSRSIFLTAEEAGNEKLFTLPADGGDVRLAMDITRGVLTNLKIPAKATSTVLIANWESAINPPEVFRLDPTANSQQALTSFNAEQVAKIDWQPLRHFWFTSKAGKRVHNMIALPPEFDERKKYPLLVLMHGGPHSMWRDNWGLRWNYFILARPGYVVLLTNYSGSTGFGEEFAQSIQGDPLKGPATEINEAADEAIRLYSFIDAARQAAAGASYGGHLANWMQATETRYKTLISHAGLINLESQWGTSDIIFSREVNNGGPVWEQGPIWREQNPIRLAANFRTPILLSIGENDFRVPLNQTLENWSVLQRLRVPSRLLVWPDENHWILKGDNSRYWYGEVYAWLKKYLDEPATTTSGTAAQAADPRR